MAETLAREEFDGGGRHCGAGAEDATAAKLRVFRWLDIDEDSRATAHAFNAPDFCLVVGRDDYSLWRPVAEFANVLQRCAQTIDLDLHVRMQGGVSENAAGHLARRLLRREEIG